MWLNGRAIARRTPLTGASMPKALSAASFAAPYTSVGAVGALSSRGLGDDW
jgi:hypothetical protein